jgi:hypothetical protein
VVRDHADAMWLWFVIAAVSGSTGRYADLDG